MICGHKPTYIVPVSLTKILDYLIQLAILQYFKLQHLEELEKQGTHCSQQSGITDMQKHKISAPVISHLNPAHGDHNGEMIQATRPVMSTTKRRYVNFKCQQNSTFTTSNLVLTEESRMEDIAKTDSLLQLKFC